MSPEELERYRALAREAIERCPPYPSGRFAGRGIVICGGGRKYFTCAWVCINLLRHVGCKLPIELWHLGPYEMSDPMRELVAPLGVTCVDGYEVRKEHPALRLNGWELKPYAIIHSRFEEVLFLDADVVPLINPEIFFERPEYRATGAIFWPDFSPLDRKNPIWELTEVEYQYEPSFESGEMVIDKRRCWAELALTMHYNEHSDLYYRFTGGDKDTFHLAWRRLGRRYTLIPHHVHAMGDCVMNQHDFDGNVVFHHRNNAKWTLDLDRNFHIEGFREEERCFALLRELHERWSGEPSRLPPDSPQARRLADEVAAIERFVYERVGYDKRILRLRPDQGIDGAGALERSWLVRTREDGEPLLCIAGTSSLTCELEARGGGLFAGRWEQFERMPIELSPLASRPAEERLLLERDERAQALGHQLMLLVRVRRDRQAVRLDPDGRVVPVGHGEQVWRWSLRTHYGELALKLERDGEEHLLMEEADGIWREPRITGRERVELLPLVGMKPA